MFRESWARNHSVRNLRRKRAKKRCNFNRCSRYEGCATRNCEQATRSLMARIAFILLCHKNPQAIVTQAEQLTAAGDYIAIHFDASAPADDYQLIKDRLAGNPNVVFAKKRVKCGWGEWSLVQATLNAVAAADDAFPRATHFYMVSGDCMPIKSAGFASPDAGRKRRGLYRKLRFL